MSKMRKLLKDISPLNNRTEMPVILYIIKVIIIFWFVKIGAELIGEGFAIGLHFVCGKNPLRGELFDDGTITLITYFGYGLMVGVVFLYWKLFQKKSLAELGFCGKVGTYFAGVLAGTVLVLISAVSIVFTGAISYKGAFDNIDYVLIILMAGAFICQGALEEVLCRGVVLQLLKDKVSPAVAVAVSTVLFVIPHLSQMAGADRDIILLAVVCLVLISILFSLLTLRFKSIWAACGLHSAWNFILYNILGLNLSGKDVKTAAVFNMRSVGSNIYNGGVYGIEASIITAAVLAATVALLATIMKKKGVAEYGV